MGQIVDYFKSTLLRFIWQGKRERGGLSKETAGWTNCGKHMYNDIFVSYFIPTVYSNPHCDTSCLGPLPPICNSVSGCLRGQAGKLWGRQKPTGASRARQSGLLEPRRASPPAAGWNVADCGAAVERKERRGLPVENVCGGIRAPPDLVLLHTLRSRCGTARGATELSVGVLQFCPISPGFTM